MKRLTELYIYSLKDKESWHLEATTIAFMERHDQFKGMTLEQGVRHFWLDYLSTAEKPHEDMSHMLEHMDGTLDSNGSIENSDVIWAMMYALRCAKDRDENYKFINGFGEDYK